jgi:pimeloyl-ACP methyl ester carboxylesterase
VPNTLKRVLRICFFTLLALPVLSAVAGVVLGPLVLHPIHHELTARQIARADQTFSRVGATREDFVVRAPDGIILRGWKVSAAHPNGDWVLLLHGRSHNRSGMVGPAEFLLAAGYSVVMMDARAHGDSGGAMATYGYLERYDSRAIVDALESSDKPRHIFALGESMGAAVALQSAAVEPRIEAVVAEGAFRNLREVTYDYAGLQQSVLLGKTLFRPAAMVADYEAEREGGFRLADVSPEKSVASRGFPILLIYGLRDRKIPLRHSEAIFLSAIGPKDLWLVPGAGHTRALATAPSEFQRRVLAFFGSSAD